MGFNEKAYLISFHEQVGYTAKVDCPCYQDYVPEEKFLDLFKERKSYLFCTCQITNPNDNTTLSSRDVKHKRCFVIIGSWIDVLIRGIEAVEKSRPLWGNHINKGVIKYYPLFATLDVLSLHIHEIPPTAKGYTGKGVEFFFYIGTDGVEIKYRQGIVSWGFKQKYYTSSTDGDGWVQLINDANIFATRYISSNEYINLFDTMLENEFDLNLITNKVILNGPTVTKRYMDADLAKRKRTKGAGCTNMRTVIESGSLYGALNKKNIQNGMDHDRLFRQHYDETSHEGRSGKIWSLLSTVKRATSQGMKYSPNANLFPEDWKGIYCPLNTKELDKAGERNALADYVICSEKTDHVALYQFLKRLSLSLTHQTKEHHNTNETNVVPYDQIVINYFIADIRLKIDLNTLNVIKNEFPHVTTRYFRPYVVFTTNGSIPIKYFDEHDNFFSPAEIYEFNLHVKEKDVLSDTAKQIPEAGLTADQPAKLTVAINNMKVGVANSKGKLHEVAMQNSLGITCYTEIDETIQQKILDTAVLSTTGNLPLPDWWYTYYEKLTKELNLHNVKPMEHTNEAKAKRCLYRKMYNNFAKMCVEYRSVETNSNGKKSTRFELVRNENRLPLIQKYVEMIFGKKNYSPPPLWNLRLWVAFGSLHGAGVLDAIILDAKTCAIIPKVKNNVCFTVTALFRNLDQLREACFFTSQQNLNEISESGARETFIGCLVSRYECTIKNSKHCRIIRGRRGRHYYYLLHFLPNQHGMYQNVQVKSLKGCSVRSLTIVITGQRIVGVGNGSKIANLHGQKCVCSITADLSSVSGITRDGRIVHPQLLFSNVSIIGRIPAGQLRQLFLSNDLAICSDGGFIGPENLVLNSKHPYPNEKKCPIKVDTLSNANCFHFQNMGTFSEQMRQRKATAIAIQSISIHGFGLINVTETSEYMLHDMI